MTKEKLKEMVNQIIHNPQVSYPPVSYMITDINHTDEGNTYTSSYIDTRDFDDFLRRLEKQFISRIDSI